VTNPNFSNVYREIMKMEVRCLFTSHPNTRTPTRQEVLRMRRRSHINNVNMISNRPMNLMVPTISVNVIRPSSRTRQPERIRTNLTSQFY
jgi:hypothetical protein